MEITTKKVNMYAASPTTVGFGIPRVGNLRGITMTVADIRQALRSHAHIEEIMDDGRLVPLDFSNFDKDNSVASELTQAAPVVSIVTPLGEQTPIDVAKKAEAAKAAAEAAKPETTVEVHEPPACDPFADVAADAKKAEATVTKVEEEKKADDKTADSKKK
jgi:hypothetical protein